MERFEVGKSYDPADLSFDPITVIKRTAKCIVVRGGSGNTWRMIVRQDEKGEFAVDSSVPKKWRDIFTYRAEWETGKEC